MRVSSAEWCETPGWLLGFRREDRASAHLGRPVPAPGGPLRPLPGGGAGAPAGLPGCAPQSRYSRRWDVNGQPRPAADLGYGSEERQVQRPHQRRKDDQRGEEIGGSGYGRAPGPFAPPKGPSSGVPPLDLTSQSAGPVRPAGPRPGAWRRGRGKTLSVSLIFKPRPSESSRPLGSGLDRVFVRRRRHVIPSQAAVRRRSSCRSLGGLGRQWRTGDYPVSALIVVLRP